MQLLQSVRVIKAMILDACEQARALDDCDASIEIVMICLCGCDLSSKVNALTVEHCERNAGAMARDLVWAIEVTTLPQLVLHAQPNIVVAVNVLPTVSKREYSLALARSLVADAFDQARKRESN